MFTYFLVLKQNLMKPRDERERERYTDAQIHRYIEIDRQTDREIDRQRYQE